MTMTEITRSTAARPARGASDAGIALVVSLLLMVAMSMIGAGLLMVSKTETYASMNYRMMSQARYGAESGVMRAANYLTQTYVTPGSVADPLGNYNMTVSPVTYNGQPVVLSADPNKAANYPIGSVQTAFNAAVQGTLNAQATVAYRAYATLVSMRAVLEYGKGTSTIIQTWHITGTGSIDGARPATVEVSSVLERNVGSALSWGVFATAIACGAVNLGGGANADSYDSSNITLDGDGQPVTDNTGARVGTNSNLTVQGNAQVYGTLSTPRTGVGSCKNGAIVALTETGQAEVHEGLIQLPQAINFPTPDPPNPMPPTTAANMSTNTCANLGLVAPACSGPSGDLTLDPQGGTLVFGNLSLNSGKTLHLKAGTYNVNSMALSGGSTVIIESGPVVFNIAGTGVAEPIDFTGGTVVNQTFKPTDLQFLYAGTGTLKFTGGNSMAGIVYAPKAGIEVHGGADFYGSIIGATVSDSGGTSYHYDRSLKDEFFVAGNYVMSAFTWRKY
jgi:Tfp pilus assembly protein PilX